MSNQSRLEANLTDNVPQYPGEWNVQAILMALITSLAFTANCFTLILFLKVRIVSFDVYLINLLLVNLLYLITAGPLDVLHTIGDPHWPLSDAICSLYLYCLWMFQYLQIYSHVLISATRVWAVKYPVSYRRSATTARSVSLCFCACCLANLLTVPGILLDAYLYRLPIDHYGCQVNVEVVAQRNWLLLLQVQAVLCEGIVFVSYWIIWYKRRQRSKIRPLTLGKLPLRDCNAERKQTGRDGNAEINKNTSASSREANGRDTTGYPSAVRKESRRIRAMSNGVSSSHTGVTAATAPNSHGPSAFFLMSLLTGSLVVCWTPNIVYFLMLSLVGDYTYDPRIANAVILLYNVQTIIDPVLFTLALSHLRSLVCSSNV